MKAILLASFMLASSILISLGQRPYQHPEGTAAHQAAQEYTNTVIAAYNNWQAMKISKQQFISYRKAAWAKYVGIAFPQPVKVEKVVVSDTARDIEDMQIDLQRMKDQYFSTPLKPGEWRTY